MTNYSITNPFEVFTDLDGNPLENGYIYIGETGKNPIIYPIQCYWDKTYTYPINQPIRTIGGYPSRNGTPGNIFINPAENDLYSMQVLTKNNVSVFFDRRIENIVVETPIDTIYGLGESDAASPYEIYVDPAGSDGNWGFSLALPLQTIQAAFDLIESYNKTGKNTFRINLAAGTYSAGGEVNSYHGRHQIQLQGPTAGHPNVPTAIIDVTGSPSDNVISVFNGASLRVEDILIENCTGANAFTCNESKLALYNIHTNNCFKTVVGLHHAYVAAFGGIWDGNLIGDGIGYSAFYNTTHNFTQASNDAATDALVITNYVTGMQCGESTQGHVDNVNIYDCGVGLNIKRGSGALNTKNMKIDDCNVGLLVENAGWFNNAILFGSISANIANVRTYGNAPELDFLCQDNTARTCRLLDSTFYAGAFTGTTTETTLYTTPEIPAWVISEASYHYARLMLAGGRTSGTTTLKVYIDNGSTTDLLGNVSLADGTSWKFTAEFIHSALNSQRCILHFTTSTGTTAAKFDSTAVTVDETAFTFYFTAQHATAGDSITVSMITFEGTYGG